MDGGATSARRPGLDWRLVAGINLLLGALLLFMDCTDYSWANNAADALFGPLVAIVAIVSMCGARWRATWRRWRIRIASLPSLIEGGMQVALAVFLLVPPFTLGGLFSLSEMLSERPIQQAVSPDGRRVAEVYFRSVGAYGRGNGRISVRVRERLLPCVERDVYSLSRSYASGSPEEYLQWRDNDTLYMSEKQVEVKIGPVKVSYPSAITVPSTVVQLLSLFAQAGR